MGGEIWVWSCLNWPIHSSEQSEPIEGVGLFIACTWLSESLSPVRFESEKFLFLYSAGLRGCNLTHFPFEVLLLLQISPKETRHVLPPFFNEYKTADAIWGTGGRAQETADSTSWYLFIACVRDFVRSAFPLLVPLTLCGTAESTSGAAVGEAQFKSHCTGGFQSLPFPKAFGHQRITEWFG